MPPAMKKIAGMIATIRPSMKSAAKRDQKPARGPDAALPAYGGGPAPGGGGYVVNSVSLARPVLDGIRRRRHDDRADELVVPALLLLVPQHPEVAKEARNRRDDPSEIAADRATGPDRSAD